ncbi:MAG: septation protein SepH [Galbitalea sp.]
MQDLRVIGTEAGALLVSDDDGTRYRLPVDDVLQVKLRQVTPDPSIGARLAPREIQAHIRAGMSAEDVATITGAPLAHIQKFEGPVLAEREFVVTTALGVPVHTALETDPLGQGATFGTAIRARLHDLGATGERWASWKDPTAGWIVKLSFSANQIDHDARWRFDPKKLALDPMNNEAVTLSQQGEATGGLIPRLRAVHQEERQQDASRFDSGAFDLGETDAPEARARLEAATRVTAKSGQEQTGELNQTADLLDALRRRRGEREAASYEDDPFETGFTDTGLTKGGLPDGGPVAPVPVTPVPVNAAHPATGGIRIVDIPMDVPPAKPTARQTGAQQTGRQTGSQARTRKGRQAMPSWDEIVFGARPDDDLA